MIEGGVRRYGFHGLSYAYIASVLAEYDPALAADAWSWPISATAPACVR